MLLVSGIGLTVSRAVGEIWINRRTTSDVRATVHSFLAQMEYGGEILCGVILGGVAKVATIPIAFVGSAALIACTGVMVARWRNGPR